MFPLNWNIPFIRKNGSRTTLGNITGDIAGIEEDITGLTDKAEGLWDNMMENGAVNLLPVIISTTTVSSTTFTVEENNVITVNRGSAASSSHNINISGTFTLKAGTYMLSSKGGATSDVDLVLSDSSNTTIAQDTGNGAEFTLASDTNVYCRIIVHTGANPTNQKFYPLIYKKEVWDFDNTYVPYAKTNRELTEETDVTFTASENETEIVSYKIKKRDGHVYGYIDVKVLVVTPSSLGTLSEKPPYVWAQAACNSTSRARPVGICYVNNSGAIAASPVNTYSVDDRIQVAVDFYTT